MAWTLDISPIIGYITFTHQTEKAKMTYHIPLCLNCGNHEVQAPYTFGDGEGFCSQQCEKDANEGFADEADYMNQLCTMCRTHEAVEDGFCSFQCENLFHDQVKAEEVQQEDAVSHTWEYEDHMAQWDNEPDIYAGTYSEE
jgi:hypothetical protein